MNWNKLGQVPQSESEALRLKEEFEEKEKEPLVEKPLGPKQMVLPGFADPKKREQSPSEKEHQRIFKGDDEINSSQNLSTSNFQWSIWETQNYWKTKPLHIMDTGPNQLKWTRRQYPKDLSGSLGPVEEEKTTNPKEWRYPPASYFPELEDKLLEQVFGTKEKIRRDAKEAIKILNESRDAFLINDIITNAEWAESTHLTLKEVKSIYNEFRKNYVIFLKILNESMGYMQSCPNPYVYISKIKQKSIVEIFDELGALVEAGVIYGFADEVSRHHLGASIFNKQKQNIEDYIKINESIKDLEIVWMKRERVLDTIKRDISEIYKRYAKENKDKLLYLESKNPKITESFAEAIGEEVGLLAEDRRFSTIVDRLREGIHNFIERINERMERHIESNVLQHKRNHPKIKEYRDAVDNLHKEINGNIIRLASEKDYEGLKEELNKHYPFNDFENLFKLGLIREGNKRPTKEEFEEFKRKICEVFFYGIGVLKSSEYLDHLDVFNKTTEELIQENMDDIKNDIKSAISRKIETSHEVADLYYYSDVSYRLNNNKEISGSAIIKEIMEFKYFDGVNKEFFEKYLKYLLMKQGYSGFIDTVGDSYRGRFSDILSIALRYCEKIGKLTPEYVDKIGKKLTEVIKYRLNITGYDYNKAYNVYVSAIRSEDSIERDLKAVDYISKLTHNNASDLDLDVLSGLAQTKNVKNLVGKSEDGVFNAADGLAIVKKYYSIITIILGQGGIKTFLDKYEDEIQKLTNRNMIGADFKARIVDFVDLIHEEINPSKKNYPEVKQLILDIEGDIDLITEYKELSEHYEKAEKNKKNENLFKLDLEVFPKLRFRVLKDLDSRHFRVGKETQCCQAIGGAGEAAMLDSFINPMAGVLLLESDGETVAQSYFHYVPAGAVGNYKEEEEEEEDCDDINDAIDKIKGNFTTDKAGYILDNVEIADKYQKGWRGIPIEEIYAYWAREMVKRNPDIGYISAGAGYSDISKKMFGMFRMKKDPRTFAVEDPYTDWDEGENNLDLLSPDFKLIHFGEEDEMENQYSKLAMLGFEFMKRSFDDILNHS